jgi:hypothetical protein
MSKRLHAEVIYYENYKNKCLINFLQEKVPEDITVKRKGAKRQKKVRYCFIGFDSQQKYDEVKDKLSNILSEAPIKSWKLETVKLT